MRAENREQRVEKINLFWSLYANAGANVSAAHTILLLGSVCVCNREIMWILPGVLAHKRMQSAYSR